ncbi:hypothetical protein COU56_04115 [Candidatus Pacearchaeota archaeon CG10_big_fil_rev_8_21_14_0_10_31_9]|nr:MAG: hypothetical protein COU56_04115 [Candidatus Pacearchaeota archaeon CG10_big_fil_rev_8_21_14_0_10_31_9]
MKFKGIINRIKNSYNYTTRIEKAYFAFINFIRLTLVFAMISSIITQSWTALFVTILVLILTFLPYILEVSYKINLPLEFEFISVMFIYAAIFLGEVHDYYTYYWWWDIILHGGSAIAMGFVGFTIMYVLYRGKKITARPSTIATFSFSFALAIGALWEIVEFTVDQTFGLNMQRSGLVDTMWDLILDSVGALIASSLGYLYIKRREVFIISGVMKRFINDNPQLFKINKKR